VTGHAADEFLTPGEVEIPDSHLPAMTRESKPHKTTLNPHRAVTQTRGPISQRLHPMSSSASRFGDVSYFCNRQRCSTYPHIGETCCSKELRTGKHDCKHYLTSIKTCITDTKSAVNMVFWWDAPADPDSRQQMEMSLISKRRSPFNREKLGSVGRCLGEGRDAVRFSQEAPARTGVL